MKRRTTNMKRAAALLTAASLILTPIAATSTVVSAAEKATAAAKPPTIKPVYVTSKSYFALKDAQLMLGEKGQILTYTLSVFNNDASELEMMRYWPKVKSKSGKSFKTKAITPHKNINVISSKSSDNITYYAVVDSSTKLSDLYIDIMAWDSTSKDLERKVGSFAFPANYSTVVPLFGDKVILIQNSKLRTAVKQTFVSKDKDYYFVDVSFMIENVGFRSTSLNPLTFYIETANGRIYPVQAEELKEVSLQPKERKVFTLKATIPTAVSIKNMKLITTQWEETDQIDLPLALFVMPEGKTASIETTAVNQSKALTLNGKPLEAKIQDAFMFNVDKQQQVYVDFELKNTGSEAVALPDLEYVLYTGKDLYLPLTAPKFDNELLLPKASKTVTLTLSANSTVDLSKTELMIRTPKTETTASTLMAVMAMPSLSALEIPVGAMHEYGPYKIKVNGFYRLPWDNEDILSTDLTITNASDQSMKLPELTSSLLLDGVKLDEETIKAVKVDQSVQIAPNESTNLVIYSKIPYSTSVRNLKLVLSEKKGETSTIIGQFAGASTNVIPSILPNRAHKITNVGNQSSIHVVNMKVYEGKTSNLFYADLELTNDERRYNRIPNLKPMVRLESGQVLPIAISEYKEQLMPGGTVLLSVWGKVPRSLNSNRVDLILSQAVTDDHLSSGDEAPTAAVKPVAVKLDLKPTAVKESLENIEFNGYTLSLRHLYTHLSVVGGMTVNGVRLNLEYDLDQKTVYDAVAEDHKLVIEFVDQDKGQTTYSKEFALGDGEKGDNRFDLGTKVSKSITFEDDEVMDKIQTFTKYRINIYDQFQDHRVLLASKEYRWFQVE